MAIKTITGGTIVTASDIYAADVIIDGERVVGLVSPGTAPKDVDTIDAAGCYVIPGGIDAHTHLALVGLRIDNVVIRDPACVGKTFPGYWATLATLAGLDTAGWPPAFRPPA